LNESGKSGNKNTIPYSDMIRQVFADRPVFPSTFSFAEMLKFKVVYREWCDRMRKAINQ
jgi:hypothetical protein